MAGPAGTFLTLLEVNIMPEGSSSQSEEGKLFGIFRRCSRRQSFCATRFRKTGRGGPYLREREHHGRMNPVVYYWEFSLLLADPGGTSGPYTSHQYSNEAMVDSSLFKSTKPWSIGIPITYGSKVFVWRNSTPIPSRIQFSSRGILLSRVKVGWMPTPNQGKPAIASLDHLGSPSCFRYPVNLAPEQMKSN